MELKKCPFCGETPNTVIRGLVRYGNVRSFEMSPPEITAVISCPKCKIGFNKSTVVDDMIGISFTALFQLMCETEDVWNARMEA